MILIFANCQGGVIKKFLKYFLQNTEIIHIINYEEDNNLIKNLSKCSIFIYQNNGNKLKLILNKLSKECKKISIPYIFNDGIASLSYAPKSKKWGYGKIYGDEIIIDLINKNYPKEDIIEMFLNNQIDFNLSNRIEVSFNELLKREKNIDIKIHSFIKDNYKSKNLFLTHNHPTTEVFKFIIIEILKILNIPYENIIDEIINVQQNNPGLDIPCYVLTPYDIEKNKLSYEYNKNWKRDGIMLINLIYKHHKK